MLVAELVCAAADDIATSVEKTANLSCVEQTMIADFDALADKM